MKRERGHRFTVCLPCNLLNLALISSMVAFPDFASVVVELDTGTRVVGRGIPADLSVGGRLTVGLITLGAVCWAVAGVDMALDLRVAVVGAVMRDGATVVEESLLLRVDRGGAMDREGRFSAVVASLPNSRDDWTGEGADRAVPSFPGRGSPVGLVDGRASRDEAVVGAGAVVGLNDVRAGIDPAGREDKAVGLVGSALEVAVVSPKVLEEWDRGTALVILGTEPTRGFAGDALAVAVA